MKLDHTALSLSPRGTRLVVVGQDEVTLHDTARPGVPGIRLDVPSCEAALAFDDEVWVVTAGGTLHRFGVSGALRAAPISLGLAAVQCRLLAAPGDTPAAALLGPTPLALTRERGEVTIKRLEPAPRLVATLGIAEWLLLRGTQLGVVSAGCFHSLSAAPPLDGVAIEDASALGAGTAALVVRQDGARSVWVIDTRSGELRRSLPLGEDNLVRFSARRGLAFVAAGERLVVLDLRYGWVLHQVDLAPIRELAVDAVGDLVALALASQDRTTQVGWMSTQELFDISLAPPRTSEPRYSGSDISMGRLVLGGGLD